MNSNKHSKITALVLALTIILSMFNNFIVFADSELNDKAATGNPIVEKNVDKIEPKEGTEEVYIPKVSEEDEKTTRENTVNDNYGIKYRYDWPNNWMYNNIVPRARFKDGYTTMIKAEKKNTSNDNIIVYSDITTFEGNEVDGSKIYVRNANIPLMNDSTGVEVYARKTQASPWEDISSKLSGTSLSLTASDGYGALKIVYKNVSTVGEVEIKINFAPTTQLVNEVIQRPMNAHPADITSYIGLTVQDAITSDWAWEYDGLDYLIKDYPKTAKATEIGQAQSSYQGIDTSKYRTVNEDGKEIEVLRGTGYQNDWTQNDSPNLRVLDWLSLRNVPGNSVAWDKDNLQYDIKHNGPIYMPGGMQNLPINDATYVMYLPKNIFLDESFVAGSKVMWAERIGDQVAQEVKTEMITLSGVERQKVTITMSFTGEWLAANAVWKDIPLYTTDLETYKPGTSFSYPTRLVVNGIYNVSGTDLNYHELDWNHKNNTGTWYKDELGSGMTPDKSKLVDNGVNDWVFAVDAAGKIPDGCTITYDVNGGTGEQTDDTKYIIDTEVIFRDEGTMVKDGAKFVGWNTKADGTGEPYAVGAKINISNNMVLYAQWVNIYTVEYDGNGNTSGVAPIDANEYELNKDVTVKNENTLEKVNFLFNGWNTQADGKGTHYNVDGIFKITGNMKLYAEWKIPEPGEIFRVTYDGNGNTGGTVPTDVSRYFKDDIVIVKGENTLVRIGYKFLGWNTDKNANSAIYKVGEQFNTVENTILYAIWEKIDVETETKPEVDKPTDYSSIIWDWGYTTPIIDSTKLHRAYINGYPDGSVKPQGEITRGEVAAIMSRLHADVEEIDYATETKYSDVKSTDWYAKHIAYVSDKGLMEGYEDGTFKPEEKITRAEYATVVARFKNLEQVETTFEDSKDHWASGYIGAVASEKWITGYPDGSFKPANNISREEVATMTNKMLDRKVDEAGINNLPIKKFIDLEFGTWSYYEIVEASNTHKYLRRDNNSIVEDWKEIIEK